VAKSKAVRAESIWAAIGGVLTGYVLWLVAYSIGQATTTVSRWGLVLLIVSVASAVAAVLWGQRVRRRRNLTLASFAFALPVLPVLLSLAVLIRMYL
jgi:DMSO/TMAO reductase YedYZ heme-binding membrane subunit